MAHPKMRAYRSCTLRESAFHIACATLVLVVVFVLAGFIGDLAVMGSRYWSG